MEQYFFKLFPQCLMSMNHRRVLSSNVILPVLFGIIVIGFAQFSFAEELESTTFIAVNEDKFEQPQSRHSYQQVVIFGYIEDYSRGSQITFVIITPDESHIEMTTYAARNGEIYTPIHITDDSQIGIHQLILKYQDEEIASTLFEILENQ
jgi:hypothetical protein